jgi:hypothetical protein
MNISCALRKKHQNKATSKSLGEVSLICLKLTTHRGNKKMQRTTLTKEMLPSKVPNIFAATMTVDSASI